jgi:hypothetical protein
MTSKKAVLGLVEQQTQAETIVNELRSNGFASSDISVLFPIASSARDFVLEENTKAPEGAIAGVSAGGMLGGTLGLLVGLGALAIPGIGPILAAGPLFAALSGLAAGAALGGVTGTLVGMGIPEIEAKQYEGHIKGGRILVSVHVVDAGAREVARRVLERHQATSIMTVDEESVPPSMAA